MRPMKLLGAASFALLALGSSSVHAQRSRSSGFFIGVGVEGSGIKPDEAGTVEENGGGAGLTLGYGFSPRWSMYSEFSGANINADGGGTYQLGHVDLGARVHFRTGPNMLVPFLQFGITGRGIAQTVNGVDATGIGGGFTLGGGMNAHFSPKVALSGAVSWTAGRFDSFTSDGQSVPGTAFNATSARVHLGLIWFP